MNRTVIIILVTSLVLILVALVLYYNRYNWGLQGIPNDFWIETETGFETYTKQGDNYFKQEGQYPIGNVQAFSIDKRTYIDKFKLSLKQKGYIGAEIIIPKQWGTYDTID